MTNKPDRAALIHISEQLTAVLSDFVPHLAPTMQKHAAALEANGFSRAEAVRLAGVLQSTIVRTLMQAALKPED